MRTPQWAGCDAAYEAVGRARQFRDWQAARIRLRKADEKYWRETYNKPARPVRA